MIAAEHDGEWLAIPAEPFDGSTVKGIPIAAPQDGTIASINVAAGQSVETGTLLATMN